MARKFGPLTAKQAKDKAAYEARDVRARLAGFKNYPEQRKIRAQLVKENKSLKGFRGNKSQALRLLSLKQRDDAAGQADYFRQLAAMLDMQSNGNWDEFRAAYRRGLT